MALGLSEIPSGSLAGDSSDSLPPSPVHFLNLEKEWNYYINIFYKLSITLKEQWQKECLVQSVIALMFFIKYRIRLKLSKDAKIISKAALNQKCKCQKIIYPKICNQIDNGKKYVKRLTIGKRSYVEKR